MDSLVAASKCARTLGIAAAMGLAACQGGGPNGGERAAKAQSAQFANGGFEVGTPGQVPPAPWNLTDWLNPNPNGVTIQNPQTYAGLNLVPQGMACTSNAQCTVGGGQFGTCQGGFCRSSSRTITLNGMNQPDPTLGPTATLRWPRYGAQCALVNQLGSQSNANQLSQAMTVGAADVDPTDNKIHVRLVVAPVLEDPGHLPNQQPYFFVQATNVTQANAVLYSNYNFSNQAGVPWKSVTTGIPPNQNVFRYTDWQLIDVSSGMNMGDTVKLDLIASGCSLGAHFGELYVDGVGTTIPGLYVSGTGPTQANTGSNITYTINYKNGSPPVACSATSPCAGGEACVGGVCSETGAVIDFTVPPNTTLQSFTQPPGATCVVSGATTMTCSFAGPVPPGAAGTFTVTVTVNPLTACTTSAMCPANISCVNGFCGASPIVCGNYGIGSTQEQHLLGNKIVTDDGCFADADCVAGNWCDESAAACKPKESNGTPIPTDPPHTNPTLNGICSAAASKLVCVSDVCDTADNKCGFTNGDGPCSTGATGNGATVCRSGVCDTDLKCGYANGDGPCTSGVAGNGPTVCRSGFCSNTGLCEAPGSCFVDSDCPSADWCNETTHTCSPKETNGAAIPNDPPHTNPTLNGTCTPTDGPVGPTVCVSAVCDTNDNKCGYADGDGPCTAVTGSTLCRSGACSTNDLCEPMGGCNVDADCSGGNWCNESTHTCTPQLPNGTAMPNDPPHASPTLNGVCTAGAATLVCASGVCDMDNKCGYMNGDGACTPGAAGNGTVVCRSGVCDPDMKCGFASGDGPCSMANGGTVCRSGMCSSNLLCAASGGCNVDADCTSGNWCSESTHTCTPTLANGQKVPTDAPHTNPTLNGMCTASAATLTCTSGVCDTNDNLCGYANGAGPCTMMNGLTVCRSGQCSANGTCVPVGGCNVDADCSGGSWCNEAAHMCTPQLPNGQTIPTDAAHTNPILNGTCTTAAATLTCTSGVCDTSDNKCGYANGDGPCTMGNAAMVCRSGACSGSGTCVPTGGCNVDADCTTGNWCNETTHMCAPQLPNGQPVPTDAAHTTPTLNGMCTTPTGTLTCQSGVCDMSDNKCGYANADGPCNMMNGGTVCRSGMCGTNDVCVPTGGCSTDSDCPTGKWCDESTSTCTPTLANGVMVPSDPPHTNPTLTGMCTAPAGVLTCTSGVCDTKDNDCGYANGDGPCTSANGSTVCRSSKCGATGPTAGVCVGCASNSDCSGSTPVCDTMNGKCVQCLDSSQCSGNKPVCTTNDVCTSCNGDGGTMATEPCPSKDPFCFLAGPNTGSCGRCMTNTDCAGHAGNVCVTTTGLCVVGCLMDSDCTANQWCDAVAPTVGMCQPKLQNGAHLPSTPASVATCSMSVGARVCVSGVCDTADNTCGLALGDGPCANAEQCRNDSCDPASMKCGTPQCQTDADCNDATKFCSPDGQCTPKLPVGQMCQADNWCQNDACVASKCDNISAAGGVLCSARPSEESSQGGGIAIFGLFLAGAQLARRRQRKAR